MEEIKNKIKFYEKKSKRANRKLQFAKYFGFLVIFGLLCSAVLFEEIIAITLALICTASLFPYVSLIVNLENKKESISEKLGELKELENSKDLFKSNDFKKEVNFIKPEINEKEELEQMKEHLIKYKIVNEQEEPKKLVKNKFNQKRY